MALTRSHEASEYNTNVRTIFITRKAFTCPKELLCHIITLLLFIILKGQDRHKIWIMAQILQISHYLFIKLQFKGFFFLNQDYIRNHIISINIINELYWKPLLFEDFTIRVFFAIEMTIPSLYIIKDYSKVI